MANDLGKAYVQIIPSAEGIKGKITEALGGESKEAGKKAGFDISNAIKKAIAVAGIAKTITSALSAGADLQQSIGGVETLYEDAANAIKKYASESYKFGVSANSYMEQSTSFAAALKSSLNGDVVAAAEAANLAIVDMADNSAKLGTPLESIQNAYQGFAKQNYTMLDNLKLGYGGTQKEMARLLADATKISGVKYDISNLADVYSAIHVIQENLNISGVAAEEAKTTISGSIGAVKAAWNDLVGNLTLGNNVSAQMSNLMTTVLNALRNILPAVGNIIQGIPPMLIQGLNIISNNIPEFANVGIQYVVELAANVIGSIPYLLQSAAKLIVAFLKAIMKVDWKNVADKFIGALSDSFDVASLEIFGKSTGFLDAVLDYIRSKLPDFLDRGIQLVVQISNGILANLPNLITTTGNLVTRVIEKIMQMLPEFFQKGCEFVVKMIDGIVSNLPAIIASIASVLVNLIGTIASNLPEFLQKGIEIIGQLIVGIINSIPRLVASIPQIISSIKNAFSNFDWGSIGRNLMEGIKNGISNAIGSVVQAAKNAATSVWNSITGFFGIHSPATRLEWAGRMLDAGFAGGIRKDTNLVKKAANTLSRTVLGGFDIIPDKLTSYSNDYSRRDVIGHDNQSGLGFTQNITINSPDAIDPSETARQTRIATREMALQLQLGR